MDNEHYRKEAMNELDKSLLLLRFEDGNYIN